MAGGVIPHSLLVIAHAERQNQVVCLSFDSLMEWNLWRWGLPHKGLAVGWAGIAEESNNCSFLPHLTLKEKVVNSCGRV
jgi:hypothetical protein